MKKLTVVIADDHPIVLFGVRELVERNGYFRVVGEAICSNGLIDLLKLQSVDLVITDFNMPTDSPYGDGLKLMEYLKRNFPTVRILVLTMISSPLILTRLHELGVVGIIQKSQMYKEIQVALNAVVKGNLFESFEPMPTSVLDPITLDERFASLSSREYEVLRLFASGLSVNNIALNQNKSIKTISTQKTSAMRKLEVTSDQALLAYCIERKMFS